MAAQSLLNAYLVLESDTRSRLNFQFMPDTVDDTKPVNWNEAAVIGRSEPYKSYMHSGPRQFALALSFYASVDGGDGGTPQQMIDKINWLRSLAYPEMVGRLTVGPPVVRFIVGIDFINSRCVARGQVGVKWGSAKGVPAPWSGSDRTGVGQPYAAEVTLTLDEVNLDPPVSQIVRAGKEYVSPSGQPLMSGRRRSV